MPRPSGSIRRVGQGAWIVQASGGFDAVTGKRVRLTQRVKGTQQGARRALTALQRKIDEGTAARTGKQTLAAFLTGHWLPYKASRVRPRTYERLEQFCRCHIIPRLGKMPLSRLDVPHVQAFVDQLSASGLAPRTVSHCYVTLSSALSTAARWRLVAVNVAKAIRPPRVDLPKLRVPNPAEVRRLLAVVPKDAAGAAITLIAYTGLRRGEALGLRWRDIDLGAGRIRVVGSLQRIRDKNGSRLEIQEPKTARGRRTITLPGPALEALRAHRKHQLEDRMFVGEGWFDGDFVFTNTIGEPFDPDNLSHRFTRLAGSVGLGGVRVHDLRHAVATALMARVDPRLVADTLGHASTSFTMDTYGHERDGQGAVAARAIEDALASPLASAGTD